MPSGNDDRPTAFIFLVNSHSKKIPLPPHHGAGWADTHLPCVILNRHEQDRNDRIAATIRHNRARGNHQVSEMSKIVLELKRRNWSDAKIGKKLGMEPDEVLRLSQIGGLADIFSDREFSEAWK